MKKMRLVVFIVMALLLVISSTAWAAPAEAAPAAKKAQCGSCVYRVKKGDTLYSIGMRYGVSVKTLKRCNKIRNANRIKAGWKLWVPCKKVVKAHKKVYKKNYYKKEYKKEYYKKDYYKKQAKRCRGVYRVRPGETLGGIAYRTCSTVNAIAHANGIWNVNYVRSGQRLCIPIRPNWCR